MADGATNVAAQAAQGHEPGLPPAGAPDDGFRTSGEVGFAVVAGTLTDEWAPKEKIVNGEQHTVYGFLTESREAVIDCTLQDWSGEYGMPSLTWDQRYRNPDPTCAAIHTIADIMRASTGEDGERKPTTEGIDGAATAASKQSDPSRPTETETVAPHGPGTIYTKALWNGWSHFAPSTFTPITVGMGALMPASAFPDGACTARDCIECLCDNPDASRFGSHYQREVDHKTDTPSLCRNGYCDAVQPAAPARFPEPQGIEINMMPFVIGDRESVPAEYQQYWPLIQACSVPADQIGNIGYLTIHESAVPAGQSQRRPGLHIESPGRVLPVAHFNTAGPNFADHICSTVNWGAGRFVLQGGTPGKGALRSSRWPAAGLSPSRVGTIEGGIFMASTVASSTRVWDCVVEDVGAGTKGLGDCEHARDRLGPGWEVPANTIVWMTDRTPHESVPVQRDTYRQFFRLVTSQLSVWYAQHSTANRLGVKPGFGTRIIAASKFAPTADDGGAGPGAANPAAEPEPEPEPVDPCSEDGEWARLRLLFETTSAATIATALWAAGALGGAYTQELYRDVFANAAAPAPDAKPGQPDHGAERVFTKTEARARTRKHAVQGATGQLRYQLREHGEQFDRPEGQPVSAANFDVFADFVWATAGDRRARAMLLKQLDMCGGPRAQAARERVPILVQAFSGACGWVHGWGATGCDLNALAVAVVPELGDRDSFDLVFGEGTGDAAESEAFAPKDRVVGWSPAVQRDLREGKLLLTALVVYKAEE